jgi:hypothetical protein
MRAVYEIYDGCGDLIDTVEIDMPDGFSSWPDYEVQAYVVDAAGYVDWGKCSLIAACASCVVRVKYVCSLFDGVTASVRIEAKNRDAIVATLESLLQQVRVMPVETAFIECDEYDGRALNRPNIAPRKSGS